MSGAEIALASVAVAGTGASVYGALSGAQAQKEAAARDASLKGQQADELLSRQAVNEQILREEGALTEDAYQASWGSTGLEGAGIGGAMKIHKRTLENIANSRRDAEFKAKMLRAGADIQTDLASDAMTAAYVTGAGSILSTSAQAYSYYKGPSNKVSKV